MTLTDLLGRGRLEQVCPACGMREASGAYCTACLTPTGLDHSRPTERTEAQRTAARENVRRRAERGSVTKKSPNPEALA